MTLERGSLLNQRYRIVEILGQGGMAAVYRAIDENLGVEVALKENLFTTDEYARQFRREALILASLRHPNLPRVTDHFVIEHQGQYLVMDYIEGEDLRQRMERLGSLPEQEVIIVGAALCEALTYLHTRNPQVLHRDIKPGNVKITPTGQIFLVDFGLAKMVVGRQATTTGARAMTPGYSPPEQYGTARTDHRSDVYSLGATLYSALTNIIPEDGLARAMEQTDLTPLMKRNPKVSRRMANVLEKALEVRPDDRYLSAEEFKNDLLNVRSNTRRRIPVEYLLEPPPEMEPAASEQDEMLVKEQGSENELGNIAGQNGIPLSDLVEDVYLPKPLSPVKRTRKKTLRRYTSPIFWLFLLLMSAGIIWMYYNPGLPQQAWASLSPLVLDFTSAGNTTQTPTFEATQTDHIALPTLTASTALSISSDSTRTVPIDASPSPAVTRTATLTATISPTLTTSPTRVGGGIGQIAFASDREDGIPNIWIVNVDGNGLVQLTGIEAGACQPTWSPDGKRLAFTAPCSRNRESYPGSSIYTINVDGSGQAPLPVNPGDAYDPAWSPDGTRIAFVSMRFSGIPQIFIYSFLDNSITHLTGDVVRTNTQPVWSPDGKMIAYVGSDSQIRVMKDDGSERFILSRNSSDFKNGEPVWSPDGQVVIFTQSTLDLSSVWLMLVPFSLEGGLPTKIPNSDYLTEVSYSPDGFWIAATGYPQGQRDLYIMTTSGVNRQQVTNDLFNDFDPAWRPMVDP
jgi:eukaryotic-like serine/threonine-protein kinase